MIMDRTGSEFSHVEYHRAGEAYLLSWGFPFSSFLAGYLNFYFA